MKIFKNIFSVGNTRNKTHKLINILGFKIKIKQRFINLQSLILDFSKVKKIENNYFCTGCTACKNICPSNAINMQENSEGFLVPNIDKNKCTNCGLCNKICPIINYKVDSSVLKLKCFAAQASDEIRLKSASGGMFGLIATYIIQNKGYVCAAKYSDDFYSVEHTIISDINELPKLLVSKYVQSDLSDVFSKIKILLDNKKQVLFVGTPCQVAGLKAFLRKNYENLFLIDLICCGIPSRKVYRKYLDEIKYEKDEKVTNVIFRLKDKGWYSQAIKVTTDKNEYRIPNGKCIYEQAHFKGLSTNKICQVCPFDTLKREGDITIGDFWGIAKFNKNLDDNKGTSVILQNTKKGKLLLKLIKKRLKILKKTPIDWVLPDNDNLINPIHHNNRRQFFYNLDKMSIAKNYSECMRDKADCIIYNNAITGVNYGSMLTAYAIQEVMINLGYYAKTLNTSRVPIPNYQGSFAQKFALEYLNLTEPVSSEIDFIKLNNKTDVFMVGSDQMWRPKYWQDKVDKILLDFVDDDKKKIAISPSFGLDEFEGTKEEYNHFKSSLKNFTSISTRENSGVDICKNDFNQKAQWILDPVFILDKSRWIELAERSTIDYSDSIVYYGWNESEIFQNNMLALAEKLNCKYENITYKKLFVEDWLSAIRSAKYVISNSFHGICFALIFNKNFLCINDIGQGRFSSLFKLFNISSNNMINHEEELASIDTICDIDYEFINKQLKSEQEKAIKFLKEAMG